MPRRLADNQVLTLTGNDAATRSRSTRRSWASTFDGVLTVTVTGAASSTNTITTGQQHRPRSRVTHGSRCRSAPGMDSELLAELIFPVTGLMAIVWPRELAPVLTVERSPVAVAVTDRKQRRHG